ncbi:MAG: glycosyltransferase family 39 protein [Pyrinomonadaceae bacterium]
MTKADSAFRTPRSKLIWWILAAVVVFVYFFGLTIPLVGPDEPRYSQVAREMFERGDWVTPTLGGFNWFEKPALLYWLQIVGYKVFGVNEFAARFGSALFGLGTVASLWLLGRFFTAETQRRGAEDFANWLALIAASSIGIIVFSRGASFDIILTFPMTAAVVGFFIFDLTQRRAKGEIRKNEKPAEINITSSPRLRVAAPLFFFYFFIGVALLAKGLIGIVFPFAIVAFYYLLSWRLPNRTFIFSLIWGTILSVVVASAWYLPMYQRHGWAFIDEFFIQHHFQRYTSNKYFHPQPFYFFFWVLPLMTIPWLPFFVKSIIVCMKRVIGQRPLKEERSINSDIPPVEMRSRNLLGSFTALIYFSTAWLLVPLVFFSFSGSKLPGYILPAVPPAIILTALSIYRFVERSDKRVRVIQAVALATFVTVAGLLLFAVPRFADADSVKGLILAANENGYRSENVLTLHTISHNAEFYAAGRLLRDNTGKQKKLLGSAEVLDEIRKNGGKPALVLVPLEYLKKLEESPLLDSNVLKDNGELAIVYVKGK